MGHATVAHSKYLIKIFKFKKSHNRHESLAAKCTALTWEADDYRQSQEQLAEKGGTACRSKSPGQAQAQGMRRQGGHWSHSEPDVSGGNRRAGSEHHGED